MARASTDNRRCKDKGPHPHHATSPSMWLSPPPCLSQNQSSPFPSISHHYLTPSPFPSLCLSLSPSPHHLLSLPPVLPLLSPVSTAAENPAQTPACVCLYMCVCVCATTVDPRAKLTRSWAKKEVRFNAHKKKPCVCVSNALIKTLIADALHHSHANKTP